MPGARMAPTDRRQFWNSERGGGEPLDPEIRRRLEAAGHASDEEFDLFGTALALAALDRPRVGLDWYEDHARQLVEAAREALAGLEAGGFQGGPAELLRTALAATLAGSFGYVGDRLNYDDLQNANLMRVMDRRKGLPVALGILYIHVGRSLGFRVEGLGLPGHFLIRAEAGGERVIFDPFNAGVPVAPAEMRELLKATLGVAEELTPEHWSPVSDRSVVMRLQNNIKVRRLRAEAFAEALRTVEGMLLVAPDEASLWREAGILRAREGEVGSAISALEHYLALAPGDELRHQTAVLLQQLRSRLN